MHEQLSSARAFYLVLKVYKPARFLTLENFRLPSFVLVSRPILFFVFVAGTYTVWFGGFYFDLAVVLSLLFSPLLIL